MKSAGPPVVGDMPAESLGEAWGAVALGDRAMDGPKAVVSLDLGGPASGGVGGDNYYYRSSVHVS
jgi:hypothetical protein